jgi:hypothetical protein
MLGVITGEPDCKLKGGPVGDTSGDALVTSGVSVGGAGVSLGIALGVGVFLGVGVQVDGRKISGVEVTVGAPRVGGRVGGGYGLKDM